MNTNNPLAPDEAPPNSIRLPQAYLSFQAKCKRTRTLRVAWYFIATEPYPSDYEPSQKEFERDLRHWRFVTLDQLIACSQEAVK